MTRLIKTIVLVSAILFVLAACSAPAAADWPTRDITFIVPFKAGGGHDILARTTAPYIEKYLPKKVNVIVENVAAASSKAAMVQLFKTKPDGYTVGVFNIGDLAMMHAAKQIGDVDAKKLPYFARLDRLPIMLGVATKSAFKKPEDMKGKTVRFAAIGPSVTFSESVIAKSLGATPTFVNYDGSGEGALAVMRGDADAIAVSAPSVWRNVKASEGKMFGMFMTAPAPDAPDLQVVPVASTLGVKLDEDLLVESRVMVAPPNLPADLETAWAGVMAKVYNDPEWMSAMKKAGYTPAPLQGSELKSTLVKAIDAVENYKDIVAAISAGW